MHQREDTANQQRGADTSHPKNVKFYLTARFWTCCSVKDVLFRNILNAVTVCVFQTESFNKYMKCRKSDFEFILHQHFISHSSNTSILFSVCAHCLQKNDCESNHTVTWYRSAFLTTGLREKEKTQLNLISLWRITVFCSNFGRKQRFEIFTPTVN